MKKTILHCYAALLCVLCSFSLYAQDPTAEPVADPAGIRPIERVQEARQLRLPFNHVKIGERSELPANYPIPVQQLVRRYQAFTIDPGAVASIDEQASNPIELVLPGEDGKDVILELVPVNNLDPEFVAVTERGEKLPVGNGRTYQGIIQGDEKSVAAITIFDDEVAGFYSNDNGNYIVGRLRADDAGNFNIIYNERDLLVKSGITCGLPEGAQAGAGPKSPAASTARTTRCVRLYYETEYDMFQALGGNTFNYVLNLYNQVKTLYNNDGISVALGSVLIWTSTDPYTATSSGSLLSQFGSIRTSFGGDLGQLLTFRSVGGGVAYLNTLCGPTQYRLSVAGNLTSSFPAFPTYSWSVMVSAHEFGHSMGSQHTHACAWNGNNTAIDGCGPAAGYSEGCNAPVPPLGGTIMSYCHLRPVGINFHFGFGPQPAARIRGRVDAATCLGQCDYFSTCGYGTPPPTSSVIAIRAYVNSKYVCAESAGSQPLIANRTAIGPWEKFIVNDAGGGYIALKALVNYRYVCAENAGSSPLIANRTWILPWEKFCWLNNSDGTFSLRAEANNKLVCAENAGNSWLIANRTVIGPWEKFRYILTTPRLASPDAARGVAPEIAPEVIVKPSVYPNPAKNIVNLVFEATKAVTTTLTVTDLNGKEVMRQQVPAAAGANNFAIDVKGFTSGMYLLKVQSPGSQTVLKFTVQQ